MGWALLRGDESVRVSGLGLESKKLSGSSLAKGELGHMSEAVTRRPRLRGMKPASIAPPHIPGLEETYVYVCRMRLRDKFRRCEEN